MVREILLKTLKIKNFKGIKDLIIDFKRETNIFGENGTGKTSIPDSFNFLLFDKDSKDSAKFDVQPLDKNNNPIHNLETIIEALLEIDGRAVTLKRVYQEKYSKVRGTAKQEFKGYESQYYVNEVPKKVTEYKAYIGELLGENLFKLITNPLYFAALPWKDRRAIITEIVGDLKHEVVIDTKKELEPLRVHLNNNGIDDFIKANRSKINKLKKDREQLPSRIDEVNNSIHEIDFEALASNRRELIEGIKNIDEQLQDKSKANEGLYQLKTSLLDKQQKLTELEYRFKANANKPKETLEANIRSAEANARHIKMNIEYMEGEKEDLEKYIKNVLVPKKSNLLNTYKDTKRSAFEFDEETCTCPMCNRKYEADDIENQREELEGKFNSEKAKKLERNIAEGKAVANEITAKSNKIEELNKKISSEELLLSSTQKSLEALKEKLSALDTTNIVYPEEIIKLRNEIEDLNTKINNFKAEDVSELKQKKQEMQYQVQDLDEKLAYKNINEKSKARIKDLEKEEAKLSEKIAVLEGLEMLSEEFIRTKVELLEEKVNSKFKYVKFKMFRNQINGGLEECCEPCIKGIPFTSNLNTAAKINAGLDIINTLCKYYNVNAPIFIDNRESTNRIIYVDSQVINLIVSKDKTLKVEVI
jgi:DNA repair exonuclease SbcCD ATPase subunit